MLNVNKIFTTLVSVSVESPFTFVRGLFANPPSLLRKKVPFIEETTNKPRRRVEELIVLNAKKYPQVCGFFVDLCFVMDCKLVFSAQFLLLWTRA